MADPWTDRAACKGQDLALFYGPGDGEDRETPKEKERRVQRAKQICRFCPVQAECLEFNLQVSATQHGVAGGLDEDERTSYRRRQLRRKREGKADTVPSDATESAIKALAHRVYDRDHADADDRASTTDFAFEYITWLRANGWTYTLPAAAPAPPATPAGLHGVDIARHALAQLNKGDNTDGS
ncbi:WhiB family transcriptional regulator [Nonomuraea sp. NPDC049152]|uniref:WhiB family transcriptional regulator n=1 Tax=Nonomuraea sp. NPDC049152 TaxID=3154350 RepID=UPI0033C5FBC3